MLIKSLNDNLRHICKLKIVIKKIDSDKIQINSPVRNTSVDGVLPIGKKKFKKTKNILVGKAEIV